MKAKRAKAWACSKCGKIFKDSEKDRAEKCCKCLNCGVELTNSMKLCNKCLVLDELMEVGIKMNRLERVKDRLIRKLEKVSGKPIRRRGRK